MRCRRLVTARRNPCLVLLTLGALMGRPDWGLEWVAIWTLLSTLFLLLRLGQGAYQRLRFGPLISWLSEIDPNASNEEFTESLKRRVSELEESARIAKNEIIAITAERKELQAKLDDASEKYEQTKKSAEDLKMEADNFAARNRALEQDNKSLEQQFAETSEKCKHRLVGIGVRLFPRWEFTGRFKSNLMTQCI